MTILEMFEREDIYGIIERTMPEYYGVVWKKKVSVKIEKGHFGRKYLVYPRLGIIVSRFPSWSVIKRTYVSFDVQGNLGKKLFAWAYITLCFLTFGLLADASMVLSDNSVFTKDMVIIPSNRKIRIYYYKNKYVDSYLKDGFNDYYLNREIETRKIPQFDFILPIIKYGKRWYREPLLQGRSLVRTHGNMYQKYLDDVLLDLKTYYKNSTRQISAKDYLLQLIDEYHVLLDKIIRDKGIICGEKIKNVLEWAEDFAMKTSENIAVSVGHGDLQTGNIYVDEEHEKVYLIDWETAKLRSIWYDAATVLCGIRRKGRFSYMINHRNNEDIKDKILYFDESSVHNMEFVAAVLLIEELGFFLEEIADLSGTMGSEIIERYEYEIDRIEFLK